MSHITRIGIGIGMDSLDQDRLWVGMVSDGLDSEYRLGWIELVTHN